MISTPRTSKATIVSIGQFSPPTIVVFQYNPAQVSRSLQGRGSSEGGAPREALRLDGAPSESIQFNEVTIDAIDQLEDDDEAAKTLGILPQLSALETLLYPSSATVIANTALLAVGTIEIIAPEAPLTLLVFGKRILPVQLSEYSVTEEAHDPDLNPIRASLNLGFRVLSYNDLPITHPGYYTFLAHQVGKEAMAAIATISDISALGSALESEIST
jgi:hypothetical protein